jgi:hypothetical protein
VVVFHYDSVVALGHDGVVPDGFHRIMNIAAMGVVFMTYPDT